MKTKRLTFEENVRKTTIDCYNEENILHEEMDNSDSNSVSDLDQESDVILTQSNANIFMKKSLKVFRLKAAILGR